MRLLFSVLGTIAVAFFSFLMLSIVWPYRTGAPDVDFLLTKQRVVHLYHYRAAFYLHIFPALLVLMAGLTQFFRVVLRRVPGLHRWVGRVYAFSILGVCGPAALVMAFYANGGFWSQASFVTLSGLWWGFTWVGYRAIRTGNVSRHGAWMVRSYALTFSAITLRLMQFLLTIYSDMDPEAAYRLVAWPSWVLNLLVAEIVVGYRWGFHWLSGMNSAKA